MLRLVSELPGLFRHGRTELQLSGAPGGEAPLQKQCAERIKGLEETCGRPWSVGKMPCKGGSLGQVFQLALITEASS